MDLSFLSVFSWLDGHTCMLRCFSRVRLFGTLWTVAHQGSSVHGVVHPRTLEWVAIPFSRGSSHISCTAGRFFTVWANKQYQQKADLDVPGGSDGNESACNVGDPSSIPGSERFPGEGNGYPLQYSCLRNSMGRGAWQAIVHGVAKSRTRLSNSHFHFTFTWKK